MSLPTQHLASKLQANWLAKGTQPGPGEGKVDDLTSLSWLHTVSIMPDTASQGEPRQPDGPEGEQTAILPLF